jgi:transposase
MGYTLYHQLNRIGIKCVILAPTTMAVSVNGKRMKTDARDAETIAMCLASNSYRAVHVPTEEDDEVKEYIRMRDDHKDALKRCKQQILAFCVRHGYVYQGTRWCGPHRKWLKELAVTAMHREILDEYMITYENLTDKVERMDKRIEELATRERYREGAKKLTCFLGIKTHTAMSVLAEVSDFNRFPSAEKFSAYLGLVPGEHSSGSKLVHGGITKAGNTHLRQLLVESAQGYGRGAIGYKSKDLKARQAGNSAQVIAYADKANERLRRKYYKMTKRGVRGNVAKTAIARELACFIWGMMTGRITKPVEQNAEGKTWEDIEWSNRAG